uniref:Reverse transcriptase domain-containing protein n=1 Tax=Scleropages formosus TaxID=113540 RepID=A0A8C9U3F4_SCLFO
QVDLVSLEREGDGWREASLPPSELITTPSSPSFEQTYILLSSLPGDNSPLILLGDFNLHVDDIHASGLLLLLQSFDLSPSQSPATHEAGNRLDLVFSHNCGCPALSVTSLHVSDHFFISFQPSLTTNSLSLLASNVTFRRNLKSLPPSCFASATLAALPSAPQFSDLSTDDATKTFLSALSSTLDSLCPPSSRPARPIAAPRLSDTLHTNRSKLRAAERRWRKFKTPSDLDAYQSLLAAFQSTVSSAKTSFFHNKIQSASKKPNRLFATFSSLLCPPPPPPPSSLTAEDFALIFRDKVKAITDKFSPSTCPLHAGPPCETILSNFKPLSESEVADLLILRRATTCLLDPIPSSLLQNISPRLSSFISSISNSSLSTGCFPAAFKTALISPLLKKSSLDPSLVENYRPVSLLSFLLKTLERATCDQLSDFLTRNHLLDGYQSGFKFGHSTETALLAVSDALQAARATSLSLVLILLDLSAAFDIVNHRILLSSLNQLGIKGAALRWFESYLSDRSYQVVWRSSHSSPLPLSTGVPQDSVLGPLLFSIYTSSLGPVIASHGFKYHCYADDTQLFLSFPPGVSDISARIAACLSNISALMSDHHLQLNLSKTEILYLPAGLSSCHNLSIKLDNSLILPSSFAKSLGVTIDASLSFSQQIEATTRSCRYTLQNIRRIRPYLTTGSAQLLAQDMVTSHLDTATLSCVAFLLTPSNLCSFYRMLLHELCLIRQSAPMYLLYSPLCTGFL